MRIIGLTGGIASGKSTVAGFLLELGVPVVDADLIAREIVEPGKPAYLEIRSFFGEGVLQPDGSLDRKKLAQLVFGDRKLLERLNKITHPRIRQRIKEELDRLEVEGNRVAVLDAPLLIEDNLHTWVDEVWVVACEPAVQLQRIQERDKLSKGEAEKRIKAQMPLKDKVRYAHRVIDNSGDREATRRQVQHFLCSSLQDG